MVPAPFFVPVVWRPAGFEAGAGTANVANVETIALFFARG